MVSDLKILEDGDQSEIGERGVSLLSALRNEVLLTTTCHFRLTYPGDKKPEVQHNV